MNGLTMLLAIALFFVSIISIDMKRELNKYRDDGKDIYVKNMSEIMKDAEFVVFKRKVKYILSFFTLPKKVRYPIWRNKI